MGPTKHAGGRATVAGAGRATRLPPPAQAAQFAEFAFQRLKGGRQMATAALLAMFEARGARIAGAGPEARQDAAYAALMADTRLDYSMKGHFWALKGA